MSIDIVGGKIKLMMRSVRTRFAPSPTGWLHIGSLRTALYEYAFAKSRNGQFILRIEDTDRRRYVPGATEKLCWILKTFGLYWDEGPEVGGPYGPYIQSERVKTGIYRQYAEKLIASGHAYYCFCPSETKEEILSVRKEEKSITRDPCRNFDQKKALARIGAGEKGAIRLRVPDSGEISYRDFLIKKKIKWDLRYVDEAMLLKSDGFPTYHLAVVVDDIEMKISHILRAVEWLPSTPIHLLIFKFLNLPVPEIGHFTLVLDPSGGKLSKRKGSVSCEEYLAAGYLPEAILNFIMLLGWAPKDNREIFTLREFVENFQKGSLQVTNPVFNRQKLDWFNGEYIRRMDDLELQKRIYDFVGAEYDPLLIAKTIPLVKERITTLADYLKLAGFFFKRPSVEKNIFEQDAILHLEKAIKVLNQVTDWRKEAIEESLQRLIKKEGWKIGDFFMNFRIALTGSRFTPPITDSAVILGKKETLSRLNEATEELLCANGETSAVD